MYKILVLIALFWLLWSCNHIHENPSPYELITVDIWKITKITASPISQSDETESFDLYNSNIYPFCRTDDLLKFNRNNKYLNLDNTLICLKNRWITHGEWQLSNNDQIIKLIDNSNNNIDLNIITLTDNVLEVQFEGSLKDIGIQNANNPNNYLFNFYFSHNY